MVMKVHYARTDYSFQVSIVATNLRSRTISEISQESAFKKLFYDFDNLNISCSKREQTSICMEVIFEIVNLSPKFPPPLLVLQ